MSEITIEGTDIVLTFENKVLRISADELRSLLLAADNLVAFIIARHGTRCGG